MTVPAPVAAWHTVAASRDPAGLSALLADSCTFRSPAVHKVQEGKAITTAYLSAAIKVLGPSLTYVREWYGADSAVLEFTATLDGLTIHGVDMLTWDASSQLTDFTVMVRPFKGLTTLMEHMAAELST